MGQAVNSGGKQEIGESHRAMTRPNLKRSPGRFCYFKLDWPPGLSLDNSGTLAYLTSDENITHLQGHEIACS